jgi:hypothetical protein
MDIASYRSSIDNLRKRAISNIKSSFIDFVLIDILECGQVEYLIADDDWLLYWQDVSSEVKSVIDDIIENESSIPPEEYLKVLKECIEIKIVADERITKNELYVPEDAYEYLGIEIDRPKRTDIIHIACEDSKKSEIIILLHKQLSKEGYIDCTRDNFISHFVAESSQAEKIQWLGRQKDLVALFNNLINEGILPKHYYDIYLKKISHHFISKDGNFLKPTQLSSVRSQYNPDQISDFKDLVQQLVKIKIN